MISERTLRKWRREALMLHEEEARDNVEANVLFRSGLLYQLSDRILLMTQELMDLRLLRKSS